MAKTPVFKHVSFALLPVLSFISVVMIGSAVREHVIGHLFFTSIMAIGAFYFSVWVLTAYAVFPEKSGTRLNELQYLAYHDSLTGLPNRQLFIERLNRMVLDSQEYTVLFIDLDRFKQINDTYGHDAGDKVLIECAKRISECLPSKAILARLGGDEFVVLLDSRLNRQDAVLLDRRIKASITHSFNTDVCRVKLGASVGVTTSNGKIRSVSEILRAADLSMYKDKHRNKHKYSGSGNNSTVSYCLHAAA